MTNTPDHLQVEEMDKVADVSRRRFFQLAGGIAGAGLFLASCRATPATDVYIGEGDIALLNFLNIMQQLEAAFYTQAVATPYYQMTQSELLLLTDMRDQEIAHREFLKKILLKSAIPDVVINFSSVTFADRNSVLTSGGYLEDMVIAGFNGAIPLFKDTSYMLPLSKMVSVEARHSAYFRDLYNYNSFSDGSAVDGNGLDRVATPLAILENAKMYIQTRFDSSKLPG